MQTNNSLSLANPHPPQLNWAQKLSLALGALGGLILLVAIAAPSDLNMQSWLWPSLGLLTASGLLYTYFTYKDKPAGIKNDGNFFSSLSHRGVVGWVLGIIITGFYVLLYYFESYLGFNENGANTGLVQMFDPLSMFLKGKAASQWFVYGVLYTVAILVMGVKFIVKYRHNKYQVLRTISVMFFQLAFAFLIPEILEGLNSDKAYFAKDMKNMWPLNYYFFEDWHLDNMLSGGGLGMFMLVLGIAMIFIISPILTYFYGKRWYCSWVCGCGGLAETAGDPFRHLSSKKLIAWKIERWMIYAVLAIIIFVTGMVLYTYFTGQAQILFLNTYTLRSAYGFWIGAAFSGVIGVGFYPILGSRVWCRFGCPMAAILGLQQRFFSRFRITTNGGQCISCGNCSTYCEMGIDVRWYAQRGQNIVRASCVGCGICSAVCPRGVLRLENGPVNEDRFGEPKPIIIGRDEVGILS